MSDLTDLSRSEAVERIHIIDPDLPVGIMMPAADVFALLADLVNSAGEDCDEDTDTDTDGDTDVDGDLPPLGEYVYPATENAPAVHGKFALFPEDMSVIGRAGAATIDMGNDLIDSIIAEHTVLSENAIDGDDPVRYLKTNSDGRILTGAAPRFLAASILGFTQDALTLGKVVATRSSLMVFDQTTGADSFLADVEAKLSDEPSLFIVNDVGEKCPVMRPTGKVVPFAVPLKRAQLAIAVFYRDSTESHDGLSIMKKLSFLGVVPSGKSFKVERYVTPETIAKALAALGMGTSIDAGDQMSRDEDKRIASDRRPLVVIPGYSPLIAAMAGLDDEDASEAFAIEAQSKYNLAAARATGSKVKWTDESARRVEDGALHSERLQRTEDPELILLDKVSRARGRCAH